jgi:hypothetical protein
MRQELNESEIQALSQAFDDHVFCAALKKFCQNREEQHTKTVREQQNLIPSSVDQKCHKEALQALHGGMAEAYRSVYSELEKAAGR